jgi:hypothetical protein
MKRRAFLISLLLLTPFAVYWQTVFHEFGFRDDYSLLREVHEEPGKVLRLTVANGRPVFGMVLDASMRPIHDVPDLPWLRLLAVALLATVAVLLWRQLLTAGWSDVEAAAIALGIVLLPGSQITVGWAIAWPVALALLFALLGFMIIENYLERRAALRAAALLGGGFLYFLAALTYQSNALFGIVPLAAFLLLREDTSPRRHVRWAGLHLGVLFASLGAAFLSMQLFFTESAVMEAARMRLEPDPLTKLFWFVRQPLVNSLALFELRDRFDTPASFWIVAASFGVLLVLGFKYGARNVSQRARWLFCFLCLPFVAHAVSLAASSQAIGYRTVFPLSGLVLVLVVFALRGLVQGGNIRPRLQHVAFAAVLVVAAVSAQRNAFTLIAEPQAREWELIQTAAQQLRLDSDTDIYIIRPGIEDRSTERVFDDEFGSLSSDADWASKEMFKAAMRERFPEKLPAGAAYSIETGSAPPASPGAYDAVIDLRKLRNEGDRTLTAATDDAKTASRQ